MTSVRDRVRGVLFGLAAGDRHGGPARMAVRLAESLDARGGLDLADVGGRYLQWWREGAFDTGPVGARVLRRVDAGETFAAAAATVDLELGGMTAGCNPAHRGAVLAMSRPLTDDVLAAAARCEAGLTHAHPLAGDVAAVVVRLCRLLIAGAEWTVARDAVMAEAGDELARMFVGLELPRTGGFAPEALHAALWFLDRARGLADALATATNFAGGGNYCPILVGSIGGARWGASGIELARLEQHADLRPRLEAVAERLACAWPG